MDLANDTSLTTRCVPDEGARVSIIGKGVYSFVVQVVDPDLLGVNASRIRERD